MVSKRGKRTEEFTSKKKLICGAKSVESAKEIVQLCEDVRDSGLGLRGFWVVGFVLSFPFPVSLLVLP